MGIETLLLKIILTVPNPESISIEIINPWPLCPEPSSRALGFGPGAFHAGGAPIGIGGFQRMEYMKSPDQHRKLRLITTSGIPMISVILTNEIDGSAHKV
jgi:hypothetical protein